MMAAECALSKQVLARLYLFLKEIFQRLYQMLQGSHKKGMLQRPAFTGPSPSALPSQTDTPRVSQELGVKPNT